MTKKTAGLLIGVFAVVGLMGAEARAEKKVLMFSKSAAYEHAVVRRGADGSLSLAEKTVIDLGKSHGFTVTATKDGREINAENLKKFDALFLFTQGEVDQVGRDKQPPMRPEDRPAILEYVKNGGGLVGTHCGGADTFHRWEEDGEPVFLNMIGGEFAGHGAQQQSTVTVVDPDFPAVKGWPAQFSLTDEWYSYRGFQPHLHVLMMLKTEGMKGNHYNRESYPITWCTMHGKGRIFYTGMGHREDVWTNPLYQQMVTQAVLWATGEIEGDASPNLKKLFGDTEKALVRINPPRK